MSNENVYPDHLPDIPLDESKEFAITKPEKIAPRPSSPEFEAADMRLTPEGRECALRNIAAIRKKLFSKPEVDPRKERLERQRAERMRMIARYTGRFDSFAAEG